MVESLSPDYYAEGATDNGYILTGLRLDRIPSDAVGIIAYVNGTPLAERDTNILKNMYRISSQSSTSLTLVNRGTDPHYQPTYLGAIVSADRSIVYWVNTSNPLP